MRNPTIGPIILDVAGLTLTKEEQEILLHPNVGGVIFFSRNYENPEQMTSLANHIKSLRNNCLLCVDQEGGRVQRFIQGLTRLPKLRMLGELFDSKRYSVSEMLVMSEKLGQVMALEVRSLGIDLSFAPVLDLDQGLSEVISGRGFHFDPNTISLLATAYVKGMTSVGMKATGKHFPGHGSVTVDSHLALPKDLRTLEEIESDLAPFRFLIQKGINGIMPAHILFPNIDPHPVGFSSYWLQTVLRQQCGFQGTIISDDLSMEGASIIGDYLERTKQALKAGCDYVLICNNPQEAIKVLENLPSETDALTQQRRLQMFASGSAPSWQELNCLPHWKDSLKMLAV